jgi:citrate lyase subunit beta/citryl-CoA lyase
MVAMAARAAGIVPVDTPYVQVHDRDGFQKHLQQGLELGYEGILIMTPTQIEQSHEIYTPKPEIVAEAKEIVHLSDKARAENLGIAVYNGKFISPPTEKQARLVLDRSMKIDTYEKHCGIN